MAQAQVVITRPEPEASHWVRLLQGHGLSALALPLMAVSAPLDSHQRAEIDRVWGHMSSYHAVMFVSAAAVRYFFVARPAGVPCAAGFRAWAPGPATARAIERAAAEAGCIDLPVDQPLSDADQFDSEALWAQVGHQVSQGFRLLVVRGHTNDALVPSQALVNLPGSGRDWLAQQCLQRGAHVDAVVAYERTLQQWDRPDAALLLEQALTAPCWMFSNKESLQALGHVSAHRWADKTAFVTHPRIAQAAQAMGFGTVQTIASGPEALSAALKSSVC